MEEIPKPAELAKRGGAWFRSGAVQLHLGVESDFVPAKKAHPGLRCAALDELIKRLEAAGHEVTRGGRFEDGALHAYVNVRSATASS